MSSINFATRFKIWMYLLNELPTDKRHIKVHKIDCYALHTSTTRQNRFSKNFFLSVLGPDLSGVHVSLGGF